MMLLNVFHHGPAELLLDPSALRHARVNRFDAAIALARVVVACIDDDHPQGRGAGKPGRGATAGEREEGGMMPDFETKLEGTTLVVRIPMRFQRRGGRK
jgi:hypothetical protein